MPTTVPFPRPSGKSRPEPQLNGYLELLTPPAALLTKFCEAADTFERQVATLQRQVQTLRRTRDLLLPRLLSGQIDVEGMGHA